jgi:hypothetical protein
LAHVAVRNRAVRFAGDVGVCVGHDSFGVPYRGREGWSRNDTEGPDGAACAPWHTFR